MKQDQNKTINQVIDLITKSNKRKFRKSDKINFAYDYWNLTDQDIIDLYNYLVQNKSKENKELATIIGNFVDDQYITEYRKFYNGLYDQDEQIILKVISNIKTNGNWLSLYDIEREFTPKSTHTSPILYSYLMQDNSILTIDKKRASEILGILINQNIPTAKIIVTSSFPYYAHNDMDTYIKSYQKRK